MIRHLRRAIGYGLLGSAVAFLAGYVYILQGRPDPKIWHRADLDAEFRFGLNDAIRDLDDYRRLEDRLFQQLRERVYGRIEPSDRRLVNRFSPGGPMDPAGRAHNWNRTFELTANSPTAGVLMLHGLSDSPYSMRALGQLLNEQGAWVVGLRLPGHGTAPAAMLSVSWRDFTAAVRLAASSLHARVGSDRPFYIVGYSNGAALAVEYALAVLEGETLPAPDALVLLSPAMRVSRVAALAIWQSRLAWLAGLEKLAWTSIQPEFDPYKYNSFTVNAGDQIYRLTRDVDRRLGRLSGPSGLKGFPRVIAFQSVADATIAPDTLVQGLFMRLANEGHALVLFDLNRHAEAEVLLKHDPEDLVERLFGEELPFNLTVVTNASPRSDEVVARVKPAGATAVVERPLRATWPDGVFSLSHIAVPFAPDDPVYGAASDADGDDGRITLGGIVIRGERNLLEIPDSYFIRLRHNPFFPYLAERLRAFLNLAGASRQH